MKKISFALACLIGLLFFASCKKSEESLSIAPITSEGYVTNGSTVYLDDQLQFGFDAKGTDLIYFSYKIIGEGEPIVFEKNIDKVTCYSYSYSFTPSVSGKLEITGTIKNAQGETATSTIIVNVVEPDEPDEPENYKFVGDYSGLLLGSGSYYHLQSTYEFVDFHYDLQLKIIAIGNGNEVQGFFTLNRDTYESNGRCDGTSVVFESFCILHDEQTINMFVSIDLQGSISGNDLTLQGNTNVAGTTPISHFFGDLEYKAVLTKQ